MKINLANHFIGKCLLKARTLLSFLGWLPPLAARIVVGWVFVESGWGKLHNLEKVTGFFESLGLPAPALQAKLVATTEFGCGLLLVVGLVTRLAAVPLSVIMTVALLTAKKDEIHALPDLFTIYEFLYIVFFVGLIVEGPGALSLDRLFFRSRSNSKHG